jgi:predicted TIM-barrel fold metal-dependent hydrolase
VTVPFDVVDAQVHVWDTDGPAYPWDHAWRQEEARAGAIIDRFSAAPAPASGVVSAMDQVEVAGSLLVALRVYGFDNSYPLDAARAFPGRFKVVGIVDHREPGVDDRVHAWAEMPETAGVRIAITSKIAHAGLVAGEYSAFLTALQRYEVPLFIYPPNRLEDVRTHVVERFPDLSVIIDHFGLAHPHGGEKSRGIVDMSALRALAMYPNVAVKASALPIFSVEDFPFADLWPGIRRVLDAFGPSRVMWGSDLTNVAAPQVTYGHAIDYIRESDELSADEKEWVLGRSLRSIVKWSP